MANLSMQLLLSMGMPPLSCTGAKWRSQTWNQLWCGLGRP